MEQEIKYINLQLIDDPTNPMRGNFEDEQFQELVESIKANGILQPILVRPKGDRFEVIAGHRRYTAAWRCQLATVPAVVRDSTDRETAILRMHENLVRADVNVVDEAKYIAKAITELGISVEEMSRMLNRSEGYVQDRLAVASMPDYMIIALAEGSIKLGVALALVDIEDERTRYNYVVHAIKEGCTVTAAQQWVRDFRRMYAEAPTDPRGQVEFVPPEEPPMILWPCVRCGENAKSEDLKFVRIHTRDCESYVTHQDE